MEKKELIQPHYFFVRMAEREGCTLEDSRQRSPGLDQALQPLHAGGALTHRPREAVDTLADTSFGIQLQTSFCSPADVPDLYMLRATSTRDGFASRFPVACHCPILVCPGSLPS